MIQTKIFENSLASTSASALASPSSPTFNQIQISSSTGLSLNDRFTAMSTHSAKNDSGSVCSNDNYLNIGQNRNIAMEPLNPVNPFQTLANQRLVEQLQRKHTMQTALKLKRVRFSISLPKNFYLSFIF